MFSSASASRALPRPRGGRRCRCCAPRRRGSRSRRRRPVEPCDRARDVLRARVEGRVVADEPEHVDRLVAGVRDLEVQLRRPACRAGACSRRTSCPTSARPSASSAGSPASSPSSTSAAPQLVDDRRLLDADRARLDARVALHARPDRLGRTGPRATGAVERPLCACSSVSRTPPMPTSRCGRLSRRSSTTSRGDSGLPVALRGRPRSGRSAGVELDQVRRRKSASVA